MIAYFDTSAIVPLLVREPSTEQCQRLWNESTQVVTVRLFYLEAAAALGRAVRMGRLDADQLSQANAALDVLVNQIAIVEISAHVARLAGRLSQHHGLRGYDAVHLAGAMTIADDDVVLVTGDAELAAAAASSGLAVSVPRLD